MVGFLSPVWYNGKNQWWTQFWRFYSQERLLLHFKWRLVCREQIKCYDFTHFVVLRTYNLILHAFFFPLSTMAKFNSLSTIIDSTFVSQLKISFCIIISHSHTLCVQRERIAHWITHSKIFTLWKLILNII